MGLFKVFKKKNVPAELPNLAADAAAIRATNQPTHGKEVKEIYKGQDKRYKSLPVLDPLKKQEAKQTTVENEAGFFKDLINEITEEVKDIEKVDKWYQHNFQTQDIVHQMRDYWENQKATLLLKGSGSKLRQKLTEKTDKLHSLETEWQGIYTALLSKESEIRHEEQELKKMLNDFLKICKATSEKAKSTRRKR